jgi:hypothetical protein
MTVHPTEPPHGIEPFAVLSALLADPFADVDAVLRAHTLDRAAWQAIEARWAERFLGADGAALADRFGAVFALTLKNPAEPGCPDTEREDDPRFLSAPQPWREEAARVGRDTPSTPSTLPSAQRVGEHPLAATAPIDPRSVRPALPFTSEPQRPPDSLSGTLESATVLPTVPVLPFVVTKP